MNGRSNLQFVFTPGELADELAARKNPDVKGSLGKYANPALRFFTTKEIQQKYNQLMAKRIKRTRGNWYSDKRLEPNAVGDKKVSRNVHSVTAVCYKSNLSDNGRGFLELKVRPYKEVYHLCRCERFYGQPVAAGIMWTGALVAEDIVATSAHIVRETNVRNLCFIFGFLMEFPGDQYPITLFSKENVYYGVNIIHREYDVDGPHATGSDWALVRLDRKVVGQETAGISKKPVTAGQKIYALGHPCGLSMKYSPHGKIISIEKAYFTSEIDLYSGNSGSPVFDANNHQMIGIVSGSDSVDFDWNEKYCGFHSVTYPHKQFKSNGGRIIKVTEFLDFLKPNS